MTSRITHLNPAKNIFLTFISRQKTFSDLYLKTLFIKDTTRSTLLSKIIQAENSCIRSYKDEALEADTLQAKDKHQEEELHQTSKS